MKYLLLCCFDEAAWARIPEPQQQAIMRDYGAWHEDLVRRGRYRAGARLQPTASATTIRARDGKTVLTDGPFAETKEQLGGYHLIECRDLDEAIAIAQGIPTLAAGGTIEVRPLDASA